MQYMYYSTYTSICTQVDGPTQRKWMYKEAQAAPSPAPIEFIRGGCGSYAHIVC
jgi:hypothetical protein